jgi:hypothetical protein
VDDPLLLVQFVFQAGNEGLLYLAVMLTSSLSCVVTSIIWFWLVQLSACMLTVDIHTVMWCTLAPCAQLRTDCALATSLSSGASPSLLEAS